MKKELNWGVIGTGVIANEMAIALANRGKKLYAVVNRTYENGVKFAEKYDIPNIYKTYDEFFLDDNIDIVYVTTPHNTHFEYVKKALHAGKHVLCEKSIMLNSSELDECIKLSKEKGLILAEAMTIFNMPLYDELKRIVVSGKLGSVRMIQANFGSYKEYDMTNRFFNRNLAGGALLDIGVYSLSIVRLFMTENPKNILSQVKFAPSNVDEQASIILMNDKQEMATISLTLHSKQPKRVVIAFEKAYIEIVDYPRAEEAKIFYTESGEIETIKTGETLRALEYEMINMEKSVLDNKNYMKLDLSKDVMDIMTKLRKDWGLVYPEEE